MALKVCGIVLGRLFGQPFDVQIPAGAQVLGMRKDDINLVLDVLADESAQKERWVVCLLGPGQEVPVVPIATIEGMSLPGGRRIYAVRLPDDPPAGRGPLSAPPGAIPPS